jgi:hypothetical protein
MDRAQDETVSEKSATGIHERSREIRILHPSIAAVKRSGYGPGFIVA